MNTGKLNTANNKPIVPHDIPKINPVSGYGLHAYQPCIIKTEQAINDKGKVEEVETCVAVLPLFFADNSKAAYKAAEKAKAYIDDIDGLSLWVYPYAIHLDGESILWFSQFVYKAYEKWERNNDFADMRQRNRKKQDREEFIQDIAEIVDKTLQDNPNVTMFELYNVAYLHIQRLIDVFAERKKRETEFLPDFETVYTAEQLKHIRQRNTVDAIKRALKNADLTAEQFEALSLYSKCLSYKRTAEYLGLASHNSVVKRVHRAAANILDAAKADPNIISSLWTVTKVEYIGPDGEKDKMYKLVKVTSTDMENLIKKYRKK